ncbi:MAG: hypothetical protein ACLUE2_07955 [Bacteroides cellulosilyticus]
MLLNWIEAKAELGGVTQEISTRLLIS